MDVRGTEALTQIYNLLLHGPLFYPVLCKTSSHL